MNELDKFFASHDFTEPVVMLSVCCGAVVVGELFKNFGRCSSCLEMSSFEESGA